MVVYVLFSDFVYLIEYYSVKYIKSSSNLIYFHTDTINSFSQES